MSKSLQKCILFAVCIALVCALGVTLFIFDGTGGAVTGQEGQASGVADAAANAYEHGTDSGRRPAGTYTPVSTGKEFYDAIVANRNDILLTGNITLTSSVSTSGNLYWNDGSQCFIQNTPFNHKIYGAGYTITVQGPHTSSQGMEMNKGNTHDYGGLISNIQSNGAIYDVKVIITKGFAVQTWETWSTFTGGTTDYWLNVGGIVGFMSGGAVIDNVYVELADSTVRLASFKYISDGSPPQYVRAGAIVGEMGANATITNVTVNNKGLIVAGKSTGNATHSVSAERWYGAVGNVVGWISATGGNVTLDNIRITGNGTLRGYRVGNIGVAENSNVNTGNFFDNFTGTYDSYQSGYHKVYVNGEKGSNFSVTNVYRKGSASVAGQGETVASGMNISATLTVPSDSAYDIYFDATASTRDNSLAIAFNQAPAASYEYTLVSGKGNTYTDYETTSNAIVFRNLPTDATIWKSGNNFTATLNSELLFNPDTYENPLTKYEHGYTEGQTTSSGRAIATGEEWENIFAPSANGTPSGTYYLTNNIVINGFTGKEMSDVTIDGNGKTIFVIGATQSSYSGVRVGGLVGDFTGGTIKNVRVVYINSCSIASTGTNPRFGLVAGSVNGSKIENVQVYVESGVTISASKAGDNSVAMGGVVGYATNNSKFTNVTLDLNGTLAPTGSYQYLGGIVGLIDSANGATFTNIILRGAGTFAGTAGNTSGEPTYYGAVGVIMAASTNITSAYATIDGLIYDFDVTLAGTGGGGQSNNSYSCYYLFTNNYNAGASGGHKTDSPISGYEGGVTYSNIFVAEKYVSELEGFAGERTNGNAAVGIGSDTTIKKIAGEVTGVSGATVTAYFVPTGNNSDITLAASQPSGGWGGVSQLKSDGDSSAQSVDDGDMKVVTVAKANAATADNKVTLSEYVPGTAVTVTGVAPQLVYSAAEQGATFTFEGGSPELTTHYSVVYAVNDEDPKGAQLGDTGLPLNAGNYTATITLNEDSGFVFTSADGGYTRQTTFEFAVNPYELTLQSGIATALAGTYGDYTVTSGAVSGDKITSLTQETLFGSSVPGTVAYTVTVADQSDGLLNASTYSFTAGVSDTNYNLASGAIDGVVVSPYRVEGTWALDGGLTLTYGDPFPSNIDQYISVALTSTDIPGGLTSVTASGFTTDYTQGTAAGKTVNIKAVTYAVNSGLTAGNYDFTGITGSGSLEVQKKELTITDLGEDASHITDSYGSNVTSLEDLATLFETEGMSYVQGVYENQAVTFTITAFTYDRYYDDGADGALEEGADATSLISGRLYAKTYYTATVTLASDNAVNDNYELAEGSTFVYYIEPLVIEITGAEFAGGGISVLYDGNAHEIQVVYTGALDGDNLTFTTNVFYNSESFEGTALTNAGEYTIDVSFDPQNAFHGEANYNYDIGVDGSENTPYTLTISPITLTISDKSGVYTDFVAADIVIDDMVSGILEGDTEGVTVTPAWDTPLADEDGWLAANTYNATLSLGGDKAVNYTFGSDNVATVTVSPFDLSGAQVTITSAPFTYNGNEQTVLYTVLTGEDGKDITSVLTPTGNTQTNAGDNYTLTLTGGSNFTRSATVNWSIAKKDVTFAWSVSGEIVEGMAADEVKALATETNNGGILEADTYTFGVDIGDYSESTLQGTAVTFTPSVTFTEEGDAANYNITFSPETEQLTVQLRKVEIGVTQATVNTDYVNGYTSAAQFLANFTTSVPDVTIDGENFTVTVTPKAAVGFGSLFDVGEYTVTLTSGVYSLAGTLTYDYVVTATQWTASVAAPEGGLTYDGENKLGSLVITPGDNEGTGLEGAPEIAATVTGGSMVNAGTYTVTLQLQKDGAVYSGGNYELTAESAKIEIAKRVVEISWAEASNLTYNGLEHTLTATVRNKVEPDEVNATVELVGDNVKVTEAGFTYTVTGLPGEEAANYTIDGAENLTSETQYIVRATLTVQFEGITGLVYTGTAHTVTATATGWQNSENYNSTLNGLITIGGADTQVLNAGDYTATITKQALEAELGNYTLAQDATVEFTVAPATLNVSVAIAGDGVADNKLTWKVDGAVTVSDTADGWTLTSGETSYTVTVTGADGVASNVLQLTLNGSEYTGTPYGTRVENGELAVASTNPNYTVELVTTVSINIVPDISIEIRTGEGYENTAVYNVNTTYTTADFEDYFYIDREPEGGTWDYSVEGVESGSFSNVGTYTVKATFTITASSIRLENQFTFTVTQATVTGVALDGDGAYTYGDLTADSTVSVTVTYSDGNTATVNATFKAATSTGGYVKAGESVVLTLTGDDGKNANYAKVDDSQTVTVSVSKAKITADIYYEDIVSADGVLTLTYHGKEGYVVSVNLTGVRDGDVIDGALTKKIIDAGTYNGYNGFEIALDGNDAECYEVTNVADLSVKVTPAEITVEWSNYDGFTYDGTAKTPTATAKGTFDSDEVPLSVTVTGDNATEEGQAINAGDYTATVAAFENGNYKLSADSVQSFSIAKATATLGIDNYQDSVVYNAGAVTVTPTVNGAADTDGIVTVTIAYTAAGGTEAVSVNEILNAGSYTVTLQISGAPNYEDASKDFVITVTPAKLTVTTANILFTYDGSVKGIDRLGVSLSGAVAGDDVSAVIDSVVSGGESAELKNAGSYTVTYRLEGAAAGNYKIAAGGTAEVTIKAKALTFTWNSDQTFTYNSEAQVPGYTLDGVVDGDEVTVTVTVTGGNETEGQAINAGEYTASVADITEGNYSLTGVQTCSFTIGKADLTLTPDSVKFSDRDAEKLSAYSQTNYEATIKAGVTVTGVDSDDEFNDFTVTTGASFTGENGTLTVGDHTFTISVAGGNYNEAEFTVSVEAQTTVTLTPVPGSNVFTGSAITFTFTGGELESGVEVVIDSITYNSASDGADSVLNAGRYTVTFAVTGNSADNSNWYEVSDWTGTISPAVVDVTAVTAVYGDVYTALETGGNLQNGGVWQFVTFNGSPVEVTVTVTDATARAGETYLGADTYNVTVTLVSGNYTFAGGSSVASTLQITPKQLNIAAQLPEDLTYTSEGIVIGLEDYASQLVGDDEVTVSMLVDGEPYVAGVTVLGAGEHTVTVTMTDASGNYQLAAAQQTFTVEKKEVTSSITVSGETIENNSSLEIVHGENARVQNAIDNYLTQNGVEEGEYTLTVTNSAGQAADLDNISAWAPGTYTVNLGLSDNFEGGMTFTIVVQEGTTAQIPDAPVLPSTPLEDGGSSGVANWLFPLIIAIECLIAVALIVAIAVSAARRSKNS